MVETDTHDASGLLCLDSQLCFPLYAATNLLGRMYRPLLDPLGLTYSQYLVMLVLWEEGPIHVGGLARRLHIDSGTMTPMLKRMEKLGLLTQTRDRADERHVMVHLTPDGVALRTRAAEVPVALSGRIGDRLGPGAAEALRTAVRDLVDLLAADLANISGDPAPQAALPHSIK